MEPFTIDQVIDQEEKLVFKEFKHDDALRLAFIINEFVKTNYDKPVCIRVVHRGLLVLHFLMNERRREATWLPRKEKTVLDFSHSSLYVALKAEQDQEYANWIQDESYAFCGGGFPIIENGEVTGAICVSGLEHNQDHQVIIQALKDHLGQ